MSLDNPMIKMSKSTGEVVRGHSIGLLDPPDEIRQAILGAKTDSGNDVRFATAHPGVKNLLVLYEMFSGESRARIENEFCGKGYGHLKERLSDVVIEALRPIRERHGKIMADRQEIHANLAAGAERARSIAVPMMDRIRGWVGFVPLPKNPGRG
jgi:tryptophanyl-tRNA synthetase